MHAIASPLLDFASGAICSIRGNRIGQLNPRRASVPFVQSKWLSRVDGLTVCIL